MSGDKKNILSSHPGAATGGMGAVLTTLVPALVENHESLWRPVLYACAPLLSAGITYFMSWFISRYGFESPIQAELRKDLKRDLDSIDEQLESPHISDKFKQELIADREVTVRQLVNLGKTIKVVQARSAPVDE